MKKQNELIDVLKFVAALFVVGIHSMPLMSFNTLVNNVIFQGVARLAVPFFFVVSAYFLFRKINSKPEDGKKIVWNYAKRLAILYLFWFIVFFPVIMKIRFLDYVPGYGIKKSLYFFFREVIWSSSFQGSWFLNASIVGALIVFWCSKKMSKKGLAFLGGACFIFTVISSGYYQLFEPVIGPFYEKFVAIFNEPYNTFFAGIVYFIIGKYVAETEKEKLWGWKSRKAGLVISMALVIIESYIMHTHTYFRAPDIFLSLLPATYFILINVIYFDRTLPIPKPVLSFFRNSSILMYIIHFRVLNYTAYHMTFPNTFVSYLVIVGICMVISFVILKLEKVKGFKWLRYSH